MNEKVKTHLDKAYALLAKIPVSGEAVDYMALARQELRSLWAILHEKPKKQAEVKADG